MSCALTLCTALYSLTQSSLHLLCNEGRRDNDNGSPVKKRKLNSWVVQRASRHVTSSVSSAHVQVIYDMNLSYTHRYQRFTNTKIMLFEIQANNSIINILQSSQSVRTYCIWNLVSKKGWNWFDYKLSVVHVLSQRVVRVDQLWKMVGERRKYTFI